MTKAVTLVVDCDPDTMSGKQRKAMEYGILVVDEQTFLRELGLPCEPLRGGRS